jgi:hypothetical protein
MILSPFWAVRRAREGLWRRIVREVAMNRPPPPNYSELDRGLGTVHGNDGDGDEDEDDEEEEEEEEKWGDMMTIEPLSIDDRYWVRIKIGAASPGYGFIFHP